MEEGFRPEHFAPCTLRVPVDPRPPKMWNGSALIPAAIEDVKCRRTHRRISEQKRQRSEEYVDSTFQTDWNALSSGKRKSKNHGFLAAFFPPFLLLLKEMGPPEAWRRKRMEEGFRPYKSRISRTA